MSDSVEGRMYNVVFSNRDEDGRWYDLKDLLRDAFEAGRQTGLHEGSALGESVDFEDWMLS